MRLAAFLAFAVVTASARAQSPPDDERQAAADLELISAVERVVARAIERSERSVVSIARCRKIPAAAYAADTRSGIFGPFVREPSPPDPRDPEFVPQSFATGVVIDPAGLVLTNNHVLGEEPEENEFYVTTIDRKLFEMTIKGRDARSDLAILEPKNSRQRRTGDFSPIEFGDASELRKGQIVIALGNPYAIARDGQPSASWGIISNLDRRAGLPRVPMGDSEKSLHHFGSLIQTDARLNLGTSGGALLNKRGQMIGLTTSLAATSGYEQAAGYALPIDKWFLHIIEQLKQGLEVEYGLLGITPADAHPAGPVRGAAVFSVTPGYPAAKAKIQPGDIITHVDGRRIFDAADLKLHVGKLPPEAVVTLTVVRPSGQTLQRQVKLAKYPNELPQTVTQRPPNWRGLRVDFYSAVAPPGDDRHGRSGVGVREVSTGSAAWERGLRRRTLISHVGKTPVDTPDDFRRAVAGQEGSVELRLVDEQGGTQTVVIPPGP